MHASDRACAPLRVTHLLATANIGGVQAASPTCPNASARRRGGAIFLADGPAVDRIAAGGAGDRPRRAT
jgi:hypothetical protein